MGIRRQRFLAVAFMAPHTLSSSSPRDQLLSSIQAGRSSVLTATSCVCHQLSATLKWLSIKAETFNVGNYRRKDAPRPGADFFDTNNPEGERQRRAAAQAAVADMLKFFKNGGVVGILDATNSTKERRKWVLDTITKEGIELIFVESRCDDEELIMANIRDVKTTSPDYVGQDPRLLPRTSAIESATTRRCTRPSTTTATRIT